MPLVCLHCAMKALVEGEPPPMFEQTVEEHMASHHPDLRALLEERKALIARLVNAPHN